MSANQIEDFQTHFVVEAKRIVPVVRYELSSIPQQPGKLEQRGIRHPKHAFHSLGLSPCKKIHSNSLRSWKRGSQVKVSTWDPLVCEHCDSPMTEPRQLGNRWVNSCTRCGLTRDVPTSSPVLQQQRQNWPPYPQALQDVGPNRAWMSVGKIVEAQSFQPDEPDQIWGKRSKVAEVMYHVAPSSLRSTIQTQGLDPQAPQMNPSGHEPGAYLWDDPQVAWKYRGQGPNMYKDMDVHAVDTTGLKLLPDRWLHTNRPNRAADFPGAWYSVEPIEAQRITPHFLDPWQR